MTTLKGAVERKLDFLVQLSEVLSQRNEQAILQLAVNFENCRKKWKYTEEELVASQSQLAKVELELTALNVRFKHACNQLDVELRRRHKAELACEQLEHRLQLVHDLLKSEAPGAVLLGEDRQNLLQALAGHTRPEGQASTRSQAVDETATSNFSCSSISYDRTRDETLDLNISALKPAKLKNRDKRCSSRILVDRPPVAPRRSHSRSFDQVVQCVGSVPGSDTMDSKTGSEGEVCCGSPRGLARQRHADWNRRRTLLAEQIPEDHAVGSVQQLVTAPGSATPSPDPFTTPGSAPQARPHTFISKTIIMPETCVPCGKRIRFGRMALKCRSCNIVAHVSCKERCPAICSPNFTTISIKNDLLDEQRNKDLCRAVSSLPRANRDTLAFLMVHLQRVMASPGCRMDKQNLARVFGPTIVGHSNPNPNPLEVFEDTKRQPKVVEQLLSLPSDYWSQMVPVGPSNTEPAHILTGHLFKPLSSPEAAEMVNRSPGCWMPPGILAISGKIFPSPTLS
ncbi:rac GTPase-activating protein 1-like isoform X4 [Rhincodon typus]|uniref:rac GTPase-activating protein 1-like isoform X4 n=1 Tax=Rhincodon typus TaxID=259920 RepID=UPI002030D08C|nr:rac GTPase-activating protein 1-like isoform X4 [Rhincodon typus]